jgi:hypothetical protein
MPEAEYQRLTYARRRSGFGFATLRMALWLGSDHLLCVETTGYTETYKRFYFRDIQAVTIRRNQQRMMGNIILGVFIIVLAALAIAIVRLSNGNGAGAVGGIFLAFTAGPILLVLLINTLMGPTTVCQLRTAVQTEDLTPLNRLRRARKVLDRLHPLIAEAQGRISPEEVQSLMNQMSAPDGTMPVYPPAPPDGLSAPPVI